ncbi:MAG: T9SS type A sorting domain-containing protein [Bacteroidia bacterium]|nr:T9SS type A sorting domain-containing protein [Bacteroidia bacterium]
MKNLVAFFMLIGLSCILKLNAQTCTIPAPSISGVTLAPCVSSSNFTLTASGASTLGTGWYTNSFGGNALNTGSVFVTPTLTSGATYYVGQASVASTSSLGLPAYASPYSGNTRGMWFTAPTSFIITGVRVPTDVGTGNSSIAILKFPTNPPTYASTTNSFNTLYYVTNVPGATIIPVYIPIMAGEVIGVLGCRSNGSNYTTSYGSAGPFTASIGTYTTALNRLGMQYILATTAPQDLWTEASSIGRIELYTSIGCLSTLTPVTVSVSAAPQVIINGPASSICTGGSATLSASGVSSFTWANNGSNSSSIVVNPTSSTIYTVLGSISPTCNATSTINVVVNNAAPNLTAAASSNTVCLGGTVTLSGSGANTYTWSGGVSNGVAFSPTVTNTYTLSGSNACGTSTTVQSISISPLPVIIASTSSVVCSGSPASLTASGAGTYTWLPGSFSGSTFIVSPSSNTTYSVIGYLGSCIGGTSFALATNPNPTLSVVASNSVPCEGDQIILTASGGLTYSWSPGNLSGNSVTVTPNIPTLYTVIGDNSFGCTSSANQVILPIPSPTVSVSASSNLICAGESATLQASGANTYSWSNGATTTVIVDAPVSSTIYTVTGTSNNCSNSQTVSVDVFSPNVSISGNTVICDGATATLVASGASNYTWMPNNPFPGISVTPNVRTVYTLATETSTGNITCAAINTIQVIVNANPTVVTVASRSVICKDESVVLTASGASTYSWSNASTSASIVVTSSLITTLNYVVTGISLNGCTNTSTVQVKVNACNGIASNWFGDTELVIFPNPANGYFTITYPNDIHLSLINELGQVIQRFELNALNNHTVLVNTLAKGIYFIVGQDGNSLINRKVVVE